MRLKNYSILCLLILSVNFFDGKSQTWTNISTAWITSQSLVQVITGSYGDAGIGCSGVIVNRLNGDIVVNISQNGLWRSSDRGKTYVRIDQNTINGLSYAWRLQYDMDDPSRIVNFSLDGTAAYTADGINWKQMTTRGRNWDYGSVDWSIPDPKVIVAARHEYNDEMDISLDGGVTWTVMNIRLKINGSGTMIGVIDSNTIIYGNGDTIRRSIDCGKTWSTVYRGAIAQNKVAVMFKGICYVGTKNGLLVSSDKGATWLRQGADISIVQGPWFGANENTMAMANANGIYKSTNAGATWTKISDLAPNGTGSYKQNILLTSKYAWDPINNICYNTCQSNPALKKDLGPIDTVNPSTPTNVTATNINSSGFTVSWTASTDNVGVVSYEVFRGTKSCGTSVTTSLNVTGLAPNVPYVITVKAKDAAGNISTASEAVNVTTTDYTGLDDNKSEISIYPNPASDYILIEIPESISGSVIICNASGIIVAEIEIQSNPVRVDVSALPTGFYLVKISSDNECLTSSFFIK